MECHDIEQYLVHYVDGLLTTDIEMIVEQHLDQCPACKALFDSYLADDQMLRGYITARCSPRDFNHKVMAALDNDRRPY